MQSPPPPPLHWLHNVAIQAQAPKNKIACSNIVLGGRGWGGGEIL